MRSVKFQRPQVNRRSGSSLDYIFALQESAEFEPTKGSRKRATYLFDQDPRGSDTQTRRIYRGTNRYDPFSTQTSMTRRKTSPTEVGPDLTPRGSSSRGEKQIPPPNVKKNVVQNNVNGVRRRPGNNTKNTGNNERFQSRSSREEQVTVKSPVGLRQFSGSRKYGRNSIVKEEVSSTTVAPSPRSYTRGRTQGTNERRPATTRKTFPSQSRKTKEKENAESLEDENYPEPFKALIKSRNKVKNNKDDAHSQNKALPLSSKPKFPTRSRQTRERTSTTTTPATSLQNNKNDQKYTRNGNKKFLFPTRKSSPRTTSTTESTQFNVYDNENFIEPTDQPSPDFNYQIKFSEAEDISSHTQYPSVQNTLKSPFLTKNKAPIDSFTIGPGQKQMFAPYDSAVTVSILRGLELFFQKRLIYHQNIT